MVPKTGKPKRKQIDQEGGKTEVIVREKGGIEHNLNSSMMQKPPLVIKSSRFMFKKTQFSNAFINTILV